MSVRAAGVLHVRVRNGRKRYRFWSGVSECYVTNECSRTQALNFIRAEALREIERLAEFEIAAAEERGTADRTHSDPVDLSGPWRRGRCPKHGEVHHEFAPGGSATAFTTATDLHCKVCGSGPEHKIHAACDGGKT